MKIRTNIQICNAVVVASILLTCTILWFITKHISQVSDLNAQNTKLESIADELRHHSDTLGQKLHYYLVSANEEFRENYRTQLSYFIGKSPRPTDAKLAPGQTINLIDLFAQHAQTTTERDCIKQIRNLIEHHIKVDEEVLQKFHNSKNISERNTRSLSSTGTSKESQTSQGMTSRATNTETTRTTSSYGNSLNDNSLQDVQSEDSLNQDGENSTQNATLTLPDSFKDDNFKALEALALFFEETHFQENAKINNAIFNFVDSVEARIQIQMNEIETLLRLESIFAIFGMLSILVSNLFSQFFIHKRLLVPLTETTKFANEAANGNTTARIRVAGNDEIALLRKAILAFLRSLQSTANMQKLVSELEDTMNSLSSIALKLEDSMHSSAQSSEEQTISIIETVTAMEEMNDTVREVSQSADVASTLSVQTKTQAEEGEQAVQKLITSINSVNEKSLSVKADIAELLSHANNISSIMNVISDIADQTNLLALNAAIEAARAGDAGRGFAVVADEVRKLAEKTMASTTGVASAIHAIQESVELNRKQVDTTVEDVEQATKLAEECGTSLHEIVTIAEESADKVLTITSASKKQSKTSEDIARAVAHVNSIAANTSTVINEVSEIIKTLIAEKNLLSEYISELKIDMTPGARKSLDDKVEQDMYYNDIID